MIYVNSTVNTKLEINNNTPLHVISVKCLRNVTDHADVKPGGSIPIVKCKHPVCKISEKGVKIQAKSRT